MYRDSDGETLYPWIDIRTLAYHKMEGFDELVEDLKRSGDVHVREIWSTAAGPTYDIWLIIKLGLGTLGSIWMSGKIQKILDFCEQKLIKALKKFFARDKVQTELSSMICEFDDADIEFRNVNPSHLDEISAFFKILPEHMQHLESQDIRHISSISFLEVEEINEFIERNHLLKEKGKLNPYRIWSVWYDYGMQQVFYDSKSKKIFEDYNYF